MNKDTTPSGADGLPEALRPAFMHYPPKKPELARVDFYPMATKQERGSGWVTIALEPAAQVSALSAAQAGMYADDFTPSPQAAQQASAGVTLRSMIEGMSVSVDVSIGDHDAGHRYFGTVTEVMECQGDKHGVTLLVQDAEPNFTATPTAPSTPSSTAQQASAHVLHLVQDAFAEVAMAYPKAFALHKVGLADTAVRKALAAYTPQAADSVLEDAARYRLLRRGQHWSVIDGIGDDLLRADALDAAVDAAMKQGEKQ